MIYREEGSAEAKDNIEELYHVYTATLPKEDVGIRLSHTLPGAVQIASNDPLLSGVQGIKQQHSNV